MKQHGSLVVAGAVSFRSVGKHHNVYASAPMPLARLLRSPASKPGPWPGALGSGFGAAVPLCSRETRPALIGLSHAKDPSLRQGRPHLA